MTAYAASRRLSVVIRPAFTTLSPLSAMGAR
jgi:hypothetical protein